MGHTFHSKLLNHWRVFESTLKCPAAGPNVHGIAMCCRSGGSCACDTRRSGRTAWCDLRCSQREAKGLWCLGWVVDFGMIYLEMDGLKVPGRELSAGAFLDAPH